jgi:hypothetical protein
MYTESLNLPFYTGNQSNKTSFACCIIIGIFILFIFNCWFNSNREGFKTQKSKTNKIKVTKLVQLIYKELITNITNKKSIKKIINIIRLSEINKNKIIDELEKKEKIIKLHNKYIKQFKKLKTFKSEDLKDLVNSLSKKDLSSKDVKELINNLKNISNTDYNKAVKNEIKKDEILDILSYKYQLLSYYGIKHNTLLNKSTSAKSNSDKSNSDKSNSSKSTDKTTDKSTDKSNSNKSNSSLFKVKKSKAKIGEVNKVTKFIKLIYKELNTNFSDEKSIKNTINIIKKSDLDKNKIINELKRKRKIIKLHIKYVKEIKELKMSRSSFIKDLIKSLLKQNLSLKDVKKLINNLKNMSNKKYNKVINNEIEKDELLTILSYKYQLLSYYGIRHNKFKLSNSREKNSRLSRYSDKMNSIDFSVDGLSLKCSIGRR